MSSRHDPAQQAAMRRLLKPAVDAGGVVCPRCKRTIKPGEPWDVGHARSLTRAPHQVLRPADELVAERHVRPEHTRCNRSAGATEGNRRRGRRATTTRDEFSETGSDSGLTSPSSPRNTPRKGRKASQRPDDASRVSGQGSAVLVGPVAPARVPLPPRRGGLVLPRLETPRTPRVRSLGPEAVGWLNASGLLGRWQLLPHQEYIQHRRLEVGPDGRLRWETVLATMARQQGKSVSLRCCAWWRIHQAERFAEEQLVVHVANLSRLTREVWRPAALHAQARYGRHVAKWGKGAEEIDLSDAGLGRWILQAADENAGIGWSPTEAHIDEGWNVGRHVADDGLTPAMSEREQPQLYLWSTAGDAASDLMRHYRTVALQDHAGTGTVLLLEWSPPEELPWDHPHTWRWASPHWSERRERFLQAKIDANIGETKFSLQYLNRWVRTANGLIPATVWAQSHDTADPPDRRPDVMAVEVSPDGDRYAWVSAWREGDTVLVRSHTAADLGRWRRAVAEQDPRRVLYPPPVAIHEQPARRATTVGVTELNRHLLGVVRAIRDGKVRHHPADQVLTDDVLSMVAVTTESGLRLSQAKSTGPIDAARALIQAVGEILKPGTPKPKVRSSKARAA